MVKPVPNKNGVVLYRLTADLSRLSQHASISCREQLAYSLELRP